jgi:hypothetical protein
MDAQVINQTNRPQLLKRGRHYTSSSIYDRRPAQESKDQHQHCRVVLDPAAADGQNTSVRAATPFKNMELLPLTVAQEGDKQAFLAHPVDGHMQGRENGRWCTRHMETT